jgi:hypothetical protein
LVRDRKALSQRVLDGVTIWYAASGGFNGV